MDEKLLWKRPRSLIVIGLILIIIAYYVGFFFGQANAIGICVKVGQKVLNIEIKPLALQEFYNRIGGIDAIEFKNTSLAMVQKVL